MPGQAGSGQCESHLLLSLITADYGIASIPAISVYVRLAPGPRAPGWSPLCLHSSRYEMLHRSWQYVTWENGERPSWREMATLSTLLLQSHCSGKLEINTVIMSSPESEFQDSSLRCWWQKEVPTLNMSEWHYGERPDILQTRGDI